jgi:hypothetical protein
VHCVAIAEHQSVTDLIPDQTIGEGGEAAGLFIFGNSFAQTDTDDLKQILMSVDSKRGAPAQFVLEDLADQTHVCFNLQSLLFG